MGAEVKARGLRVQTGRTVPRFIATVFLEGFRMLRKITHTIDKRIFFRNDDIAEGS